MVCPQVSEISMKNRTQAFKCASAVIACISIVFLSSKLWSNIPGESITYHLIISYITSHNYDQYGQQISFMS